MIDYTQPPEVPWIPLTTTLRGLDEIAKYMKVSRRTIVRWIETAGFPAIRFCSAAYWTTPSAIDLWLISIYTAERKARPPGAHTTIPTIEM
jgi:hypothetical protein